MPNYQHLLLALAYDVHSEALIQKALNLKETLAANLSLVHVLDNIAMPDTPYGTRINLDEPSDYSLLEDEKDHLKKLADRLGMPHDQVWLIWGRPEQEISQLAKQESIDLIIMGFHHHHGLYRLLNNTVNGVVDLAHCDLLALYTQ